MVSRGLGQIMGLHALTPGHCRLGLGTRLKKERKCYGRQNRQQNKNRNVCYAGLG
ncbi:MAG: hypothetical protein PVH36_01535 [Desulfobacterales bacterium]